MFFFQLGGIWTQVLIVLGILAGVFHPIRKEIVPLGVVYLAIVVSASAMNDLAFVGPIMTDLTTVWVDFLEPVVLITMLM